MHLTGHPLALKIDIERRLLPMVYLSVSSIAVILYFL